MLRTLHAALQGAIESGLQAHITDRVVGRDTEFEADWRRATAIPGYFSEASAAALWAVIADTQPTSAVEIGSYLGRSTVLIGLALQRFLSNPRLVAIDPHTGDRQQLQALQASQVPTLELFRSHVAGAGLADVVEVRVATADAVAETWDDPIDLLFVDGWHSYDAVRSDSENYASRLTTRGFVCYDDYLVYEEVRAAVIDACAALGLTFYGTVATHAWAGRPSVPPKRLQSAIQASRGYEWAAVRNQRLRARLDLRSAGRLTA